MLSNELTNLFRQVQGVTSTVLIATVDFVLMLRYPQPFSRSAETGLKRSRSVWILYGRPRTLIWLFSAMATGTSSPAPSPFYSDRAQPRSSRCKSVLLSGGARHRPRMKDHRRLLRVCANDRCADRLRSCPFPPRSSQYYTHQNTSISGAFTRRYSKNCLSHYRSPSPILTGCYAYSTQRPTLPPVLSHADLRT